MKVKIIVALLLFGLWIILFCTRAAAQNQIKSGVMASGGGVAANGSFRTLSTVGQPVVGKPGDASTSIGSGFWSQNIDIVTRVEPIASEQIPQEFRLEQNYPNPFNPTTTIEFALPRRSTVALDLYDVLGRKVAVLVDKELKAGIYKVRFQAEDLPSGIYFYRIQADHFVRVKKLTLLK